MSTITLAGIKVGDTVKRDVTNKYNKGTGPHFVLGKVVEINLGTRRYRVLWFHPNGQNDKRTWVKEGVVSPLTTFSARLEKIVLPQRPLGLDDQDVELAPTAEELTAAKLVALGTKLLSHCYHCGHECSGESLEQICIDGWLNLVEVCEPEQVCWSEGR